MVKVMSAIKAFNFIVEKNSSIWNDKYGIYGCSIQNGYLGGFKSVSSKFLTLYHFISLHCHRYFINFFIISLKR